MTTRKSLKDVSWLVTEEQYRADPAFSYSTLAKYEREGFNKLDTLFDKVESPSLTLGSAVDALITGGEQEFNDRFMVATFPDISDKLVEIVKELYKIYSITYTNLEDIPNSDIIEVAASFNYQNNWKPETRAKVIKENCSEYYKLLYVSQDKTILSQEVYDSVVNMVDALKNSPATQYYFQNDDPFDDSVERYYQLKFKTTLNDINYRCMFDELLVSHEDKTIQPIDLKTSYKKEWDFYKSFVEWNYSIQNRLYVRILRKVLSKDDYYAQFTILPYKDIVVCKDSLTPLVWNCGFTYADGTLHFGKNNQIEMRDPEDIAKELKYYLEERPIVPTGIQAENHLEDWLNKL